MDCDHEALGKAPRGHRIAMCPACGVTFYGFKGNWEATGVPICDPTAVSEHQHFDAVIGHVFSQRKRAEKAAPKKAEAPERGLCRAE